MTAVQALHIEDPLNVWYDLEGKIIASCVQQFIYLDGARSALVYRLPIQ